jgi:hypothetical protein
LSQLFKESIQESMPRATGEWELLAHSVYKVGRETGVERRYSATNSRILERRDPYSGEHVNSSQCWALFMETVNQ